MTFSDTTRAVRAGIENDPGVGAVVPPIYLSTNYAFNGFGEPGPFDYSRAGNPTRSILAQALAEAEGGAGAVVTASGMGAVAAVVHAFGRRDGVVVLPHDCYGGTWRLFDALASTGAFRLEIVDLTRADASNRLQDLRPHLVWAESPSNPLLRLTDLEALADVTHGMGGLLAVDNTFCSPVGQRPLRLGADLVVHSTTKYINGHSDVIAGAVVGATDELAEKVSWWANCLGVTGGALDAYLTLRGLRTLSLRMERHSSNAHAVATALDGHPALEALHYPGLPTHPDHELARRQLSVFGGIVSLDVAGGHDGVRAFLDGLSCFSLAESLGGVESLVAHPATMTHAAMPPATQKAAGITPGLLRLSVGIEDRDDLIADLQAGLDRVLAAGFHA